MQTASLHCPCCYYTALQPHHATANVALRPLQFHSLFRRSLHNTQLLFIYYSSYHNTMCKASNHHPLQINNMKIDDDIEMGSAQQSANDDETNQIQCSSTPHQHTSAPTRGQSDSCLLPTKRIIKNNNKRRRRSVHFIDGRINEPPKQTDSIPAMITKVYTRPPLTKSESLELFYSEEDFVRFRRQCLGGEQRRQGILPMSCYDVKKGGDEINYCMLGLYLLMILNLISALCFVGTYYFKYV